MSRAKQAKYRCRLCGEIFTNGVCGEETANAAIAALTVMPDFNPEGSGIGVHRYNVHRCNDVELGFADFIGFEESAYWWMRPDEFTDEEQI